MIMSLKDLAYDKAIKTCADRQALSDYSNSVELSQTQLTTSVHQETYRGNWVLAIVYLKKLNTPFPSNKLFLENAYPEYWDDECFKSYIKFFALHASHPSDLCNLATIFSLWTDRHKLYYKYLKMVASRMNVSAITFFIRNDHADFKITNVHNLVISISKAPELFTSFIDCVEFMYIVVSTLKHLNTSTFTKIFSPLFKNITNISVARSLFNYSLELVERAGNNIEQVGPFIDTHTYNANMLFVVRNVLRMDSSFIALEDIDTFIDRENYVILKYIDKQHLNTYINSYKQLYTQKLKRMDALYYL